MLFFFELLLILLLLKYLCKIINIPFLGFSEHKRMYELKSYFVPAIQAYICLSCSKCLSVNLILIFQVILKQRQKVKKSS